MAKNWYKKSQQSKTMVIVRGVSGSGKTQLAKELSEDGVVLSTDDYFYDDEGNYNFEPGKLSEAHQWNRNRTEEIMGNDVPLVIIDNTSTRLWEMKNYVELAQKYGYEVKFVQPDWHPELYDKEGKWNFDFLKGKNIHGVPDKSLQKMIDRYEYNPTVEKVLESKAPWE